MSFRDISRRTGTPTPPKRRASERNNGGVEYSPALSRTRKHSLPLHTSVPPSQYKQPPYIKQTSDPTFNATNTDKHQLRVSQQREEDYAIQVMREREEELRDINRKMHVVNEIYKDLGEVVDGQQEQIDTIEDQFGRGSDNTKRGLEQLEKANSKGKKKSDAIQDGEETEGQDDCQFFSLKYVQNKISSIGKMVSVCGGAGSASYSLGENGR
jgi:hypothetical protein